MHCAHKACVVARSRAHTTKSCAQRAHVARMLGVLWSRHAQAACLMSRHKNTTRQPKPCCDIKSVSRHHSVLSRSRPQNGVATPFLLPSPKPGRDTETRSRPPWRPTYVATSISCRDLVSAHSGISRSRHQNPGRDLPQCHSCRDLKNDVATSNQLSPISATSRRHFSMSRPPLLPPMSRPQNDVATSNSIGQITTFNFQVATPQGHPTSRPQIHVATPFLPQSEKQCRDLKTRSRHQIPSVLLRRQKPR